MTLYNQLLGEDAKQDIDQGDNLFNEMQNKGIIIDTDINKSVASPSHDGEDNHPTFKADSKKNAHASARNGDEH